jgi:hypothetical protein
MWSINRVTSPNTVYSHIQNTWQYWRVCTNRQTSRLKYAYNRNCPSAKIVALPDMTSGVIFTHSRHFASSICLSRDSIDLLHRRMSDFWWAELREGGDESLTAFPTTLSVIFYIVHSHIKALKRFWFWHTEALNWWPETQWTGRKAGVEIIQHKMKQQITALRW